MIGLYILNRVVALVFVTATGDAQHLPPVINLCGAVCVHSAVDHDSVGTILVSFGDVANVIFVCGVRKALVVYDDVVSLCPVFVLIEIDLRFGPFAAGLL